MHKKKKIEKAQPHYIKSTLCIHAGYLICIYRLVSRDVMQTIKITSCCNLSHIHLIACTEQNPIFYFFGQSTFTALYQKKKVFVLPDGKQL